MKLKIFRIRQNAKLPSKKHDTDAGYDLFFSSHGEFPYRSDGEKEDIIIYPGESAFIPTGIKMEIPEGYAFVIKNKSSIAAKKQLLVGACVIDRLFDGEVFINLHNVGPVAQRIKPGQKVAQGLLTPIGNPEIVEVLDESELNVDTKRGDGCLGSTGEY